MLVAALAFAVRIAHAWFVSRTPFFAGPIIDAYTYRTFAEHIANTEDFGGPFYQPPLYPAFLALLFKLQLRAPWAIAIVQSALGAATAALMVGVGRVLASRNEAPPRSAGAIPPKDGARAVGLGSGVVTALYGPFVLFDLELLPPVLLDLLLAAALLIALSRARTAAADAALGLALGLATIGFGLCALLVPGVLALRARRLSTKRVRVVAVAIALLLAAAPIALTARHNAAQGAPGVLVSFNAGINLWLGNNPHWRETWRARPGASFEPELERPDREGVTRPAARSAYFVQLVLRDVAAHPLAALERTAEKLYYVFHGREIRRNQEIETLRSASPILCASIWELGVCFPFGLIAPLALVAVARRRREPDVRIVAISALLYAIGVAVFFAAARYRLALVLLMIPLAVDQLSWLRAASQRRTGALVLLALALLFLNLPNAFTASLRADAAERGILEAQAWRNQGNSARADGISAGLVARFPDDANVRMLRAELLVARGHCEQAIAQLQRVIALAPRASTPRVMLGSCFDELGDPAAAERAFAGALSLHPYHPLALQRAGALYARYGRKLEARALLTRFVDSGYSDPEVTRLLAQLGSAGER